MMKRFLTILITFILTLQLFCSTVNAQTTITINYNNTIADSPEYYGSGGVFWTIEDIDIVANRMQASDMNIFRIFIFPLFVESSNDDNDPNHINWSGFNFKTAVPWFGRTLDHDTIFETIRDLNVTVMPNIAYLSPWLSRNQHDPTDMWSTYPPNNQQEYGEFVYATL
ncbi:MAG: hypothetical protein ACFFDT_35915, partial [Candidatus Hodarchaeota archaeon]